MGEISKRNFVMAYTYISIIYRFNVGNKLIENIYLCMYLCEWKTK